MISRFSAFRSSAALLKLNEPVTTTAKSMIITLLWAMACLASIQTGIPAFLMKVALEYRSVRWLLSRITLTETPRLCASLSAAAIGADVKL